MAIHRGIQSAIFYYLSCAPCAEVRYKKRRKREAIQSRLERELLEEEHPNLYRHPSPSSTNPHWQADIALGPALAVRGKRRGNGVDTNRGRRASRFGTNASAEPSSLDLAGSNSVDGRNDSNWNTRLYQREDEELWGSTSNLGGSIYGNSPRRPPKALTKESPPFRNPAINDMHPATVTTVNSRDEILWMMQPPPVAEIMNGKERASRSRSDSGASRLNPSSIALSRRTSSRLTQHRATPMSRECSNQTSNGANGQPHDRSATTSERDFAVSPIQPEPSRTKRRSTPIETSHDSEESVEKTIRRFSLAPAAEIGRKPQVTRVASRPQLSTIASDNDIPVLLEPGFRTPPRLRSKENSQPVSGDMDEDDDDSPPTPAPVVVSDTSIKFELAPRSINGKVIRTATAPDIKDTVGIRYAGHHKHEDSEDDFLSMRPDVIDSWYTPDFELGSWVHEHTKREVKQRWSMDL